MNTIPDLKAVTRVLTGDGTWPFRCYVIGDDLWLIHAGATCFGGGHDPQDDGSTASGRSTLDPACEGVSLPMDGRGRHMSPAVHKAVDGSPIPWLPWFIPIEVMYGDSVSFTAPLIDLGPAKVAKNDDHALDLTVACARKIDPRATARSFGVHVNARIIGGAKFAPKA